jgi:predicted transcriptional regulator
MMRLQPIPMHVDIIEMAEDLNSLGWPDYKIEMAAGVGQGYIAQMRRGRIVNPGYQTAARFYNFWLSETDFERNHAHAHAHST